MYCHPLCDPTPQAQWMDEDIGDRGYRWPAKALGSLERSTPSDLSTYFGPLFSTFHCAGHLQAPPVPAIPTGITAPRRVPSTALESLLYAALVPLLSLRLGSRRGAVIPYRYRRQWILLSTVPTLRACARCARAPALSPRCARSRVVSFCCQVESSSLFSCWALQSPIVASSVSKLGRSLWR